VNKIFSAALTRVFAIIYIGWNSQCVYKRFAFNDSGCNDTYSLVPTEFLIRIRAFDFGHDDQGRAAALSEKCKAKDSAKRLKFGFSYENFTTQ